MVKFHTLIRDLKRCGFTQAGIAAKLKVSQPAISYLLTAGREPKYTLGAALVELHSREMAKYRRRNAA